MLTPFPPASYNCITPSEKPLATSAQSRQGAQRFPYPAWPEITNLYQMLCLPTLMRAIYSFKHGLKDEFEVVAASIEEYLSRPEILEPAVSQEFMTLRSQIAPVAYEPITSDAGRAYIDFLMKYRESIERIGEASMQSSIYGNLENFIGSKGAFSWGHEHAHRLAMLLYSGFVLDDKSKRSHAIIELLAKAKLSRKRVAKLWEQFVEVNHEIIYLVQKFEPIEEIFATYVGMRFSPSQVRNEVESKLKEALEAKNWYTAYTTFAETCDNYPANRPLGVASHIFDIVCRMLEQVDIASVYLLTKVSEICKIMWSWSADESTVKEDTEKIEVLLEQAGIPSKTFWSIFDNEGEANTKLRRLYEAIDNNFSRREDQELILFPLVILIGRPSWKDITPIIFFDSQQVDEYGLITIDRIFYESLRQQLTQRCGIVCPMAFKGKPCCEAKKDLHRLYTRLPKEDRIYFERPNCDLVR